MNTAPTDFSHFQYSSGSLHTSTACSTSVRVSIPNSAFNVYEYVSCFRKMVTILSSSQPFTYSLMAATKLLKYKEDSTLLVLRISFFEAILRYCFFIRSQSFSQIEQTVLNLLKKVLRLLTGWWSVWSRVFHSLPFKVLHMRSKCVSRTIKQMSFEGGAESLLFPLSTSLLLFLFIFSTTFLLLYVELSSKPLTECWVYFSLPI